jgi:hypothetical protein
MMFFATTVIVHQSNPTPPSYWWMTLIVSVGAGLILAMLAILWKLPKWMVEGGRKMIREELSPLQDRQDELDADILDLRMDFTHHSHDPKGFPIVRTA